MRNEKIAENCVSAFRQALNLAGEVFAHNYLRLSESGNSEESDIKEFKNILNTIGDTARAEVINEEDVQMTARASVNYLTKEEPSIEDDEDEDEDCDCMDDDESSSADERLNASLDHLVEVLRDVRNNLRR